MEDLAAAENQLLERENALQEVKNQYDAAVGEKQRLTDAANVCLRKMTAATALINGLQGEKLRWTSQSKEFKVQLGKLVGDVLLATGFLSYCGPYNQEFRSNLLRTWMTILKSKNIPFTTNLNITNMMVDSSTVSEWTLQASSKALNFPNIVCLVPSFTYFYICSYCRDCQMMSFLCKMHSSPPNHEAILCLSTHKSREKSGSRARKTKMNCKSRHSITNISAHIWKIVCRSVDRY